MTLSRELVERMQRGVDALSAAAGESDLLGFRIDQVGHLGAGIIDRVAGAFGCFVGARWIGVTFLQPWQHGLQHLRQKPSGCVGVEVDHDAGAFLNRAAWQCENLRWRYQRFR